MRKWMVLFSLIIFSFTSEEVVVAQTDSPTPPKTENSEKNGFDLAESPQELIDLTLDLLQTGYHWEANSQEWGEDYQEIQSKKATVQSDDQAVKLLIPLVHKYGGKHSYLGSNKDLSDSKEAILKQPEDLLFNDRHGELPSHHFEDGVLFVKVPRLFDFKKHFRRHEAYVDALLEAFDRPGITGVILDLRENNGGSLTEMLMGLLPLYPNGDLLYYIDHHGQEKVLSAHGKMLTIGNTDLYVDHQKLPPIPIALLIGPDTASAGETIALTLMVNDHVKLFGQDTAGYTSSNNKYVLNNDYFLLLTQFACKSIGGRVYMEEAIHPDIVTDQPELDALRWLKHMRDQTGDVTSTNENNYKSPKH